MKRVLLIILAVVLLVAGIYAVVVFMTPQQSGTQTEPTNTSFPTSGSANTTVPGGTVSMTLPTPGGAVLHTKNFLASPETKADSVNTGYYYLGYSASESAPYLIQYIAATNYFNIELLREPLGATRKAAETYLMSALGVSAEELCSLDYTVGTPNSVNSTYAGTNLGFSFCPDAVKLP